MCFTSQYIMLLLAALSFLTPLTQGYQTMVVPSPLRYPFGQFMEATNPLADNYTLPLTPAQFPCKGYMGDMMNLPNAIGTPGDRFGMGSQATTFTAGYNATIVLSGQLLGGSGQISMSGNNGSLTVIHSFEGSVGITVRQQLTFVIPADTPLGTNVLSFTYFPLGNNEVFQSCASVGIFPADKDAAQPTTPFAQRPDIFISDLDNGCVRERNVELMFPDPGPDYTMKHTIPYSMEGHTLSGTCTPVNGFGNGAKDSATGVKFPDPVPAPTVGFSSASNSATSSQGSAPTSIYDLVQRDVTLNPFPGAFPTDRNAKSGFASNAPLSTGISGELSDYPFTHTQTISAPTLSTITHASAARTRSAGPPSASDLGLPIDQWCELVIKVFSEPLPTECYTIPGFAHATSASTIPTLSTIKRHSSSTMMTSRSQASNTNFPTPSKTQSPHLSTSLPQASSVSASLGGTGNGTVLAIPISMNGLCGGVSGVFGPIGPSTRCPGTLCCSAFGFCGTGANYCGNFTCRSDWGTCSQFDNGSLESSIGGGKVKKRWMGRFGRRV